MSNTAIIVQFNSKWSVMGVFMLVVETRVGVGGGGGEGGGGGGGGGGEMAFRVEAELNLRSNPRTINHPFHVKPLGGTLSAWRVPALQCNFPATAHHRGRPKQMKGRGVGAP